MMGVIMIIGETKHENGLYYQERTCSINGGKTKVSNVTFVIAKTLEDCGQIVELGVYTEAQLCKMLSDKIAIVAQTAARRSATGGKISQTDYDRLWNGLSDAEKLVPIATVRANINKLWIDENTVDETIVDEVEETE